MNGKLKMTKIVIFGSLVVTALLLSACDCDDGPTEPEPYNGVWELTPTPAGSGSVNDIYMLSATDG